MRPVSIFLIAVFQVSIATGVASAQTGPEILEQAEEAFGEIEYERAAELADAALAAGGSDVDGVARAYELKGIALSALRQMDEAEDAFRRLLALRPNADVTSQLAPHLRRPFLQARTYWTDREPMGFEIELFGRRQQIRVALNDPLEMVETSHLELQIQGTAEVIERREPRKDRQAVFVPGLEPGATVGVVLWATDADGNRVIEQGSKDAPVLLKYEKPRAPEGAAPEETGFPWLWASIGAAAAVGAAVGLFFVLNQPQPNITTDVSIGL